MSYITYRISNDECRNAVYQRSHDVHRMSCVVCRKTENRVVYMMSNIVCRRSEISCTLYNEDHLTTTPRLLYNIGHALLFIRMYNLIKVHLFDVYHKMYKMYM